MKQWKLGKHDKKDRILKGGILEVEESRIIILFNILMKVKRLRLRKIQLFVQNLTAGY